MIRSTFIQILGFFIITRKLILVVKIRNGKQFISLTKIKSIFFILTHYNLLKYQSTSYFL